MKFVLETTGDEFMLVLGIHEAEVILGRHIFHHVVFIANLTLIEQHKF